MTTITKERLSTYTAKQQLVILIGSHFSGLETVLTTHGVDLPDWIMASLADYMLAGERLLKAVEAED